MGLARRLAHHALRFEDQRLHTTVAGLRFDNPLGLAAGFDKSARAVPMLAALGFGHVEIGSISARPSLGNPRPRLFRLPEDQAIVVAYGVPNDGATAVRERLAGYSPPLPLGINLVATNDASRSTDETGVLEDYTASFRALHECASYVTLNLSCPNTTGERDFFDRLPRVHALLTKLRAVSQDVPVFLKLKPTVDDGVLREIVAIADDFPFAAGFAINLPAGKPSGLKLSVARERLAAMPGAVAGPPVEDLVNAALSSLYRIVAGRDRYALIAAGGVCDGAGAYRKIQLGASLVQLYTALVYQGPAVVRRTLEELSLLLERDGFANVAESVGCGWR
jgi:dihydroorotate dehydrogenase